METRTEYRDRVYRFMKEKIAAETLCTGAALTDKVAGDGSFRTFVGDTVVFPLEGGSRKLLSECRDLLYDACGDMLAERLRTDTFHITLHDLSSGRPSEELWRRSEQNAAAVLPLLRDIRAREGAEIRLRAVSAFPMVNTSVVLGFEPEEERSCRLLMEMYEDLQRVVKLTYPLTLHATLAYFKPGVYGGGAVRRLAGALREINRIRMPMTVLHPRQLQYQRFDDMNHYYRVH